jgi:two-component system response regulator (stage 0 sporulation protein A)
VKNQIKSAEYVILETQVTNIIYKLGVPANIKGYRYLREAIILAVNNPDIIYAVTKELYPAVAQIFDTTTPRVERSIRHAITVAWRRMDTDIINEYFRHRMSFSMTKPTNSEFIATISDRLLLRMNEA